MEIAVSPTARLLIVDDEAAQVTALCRTLRAEGYSAMGFTVASEALAALREGAFDILVTDLTMPETDGIALLRAARGLDAGIVGILMTGHGTIETAIEAMKSGAIDYILEPSNPNGIVSVLSRALAMSHLRRENMALTERVERRTAELEAANRELLAANNELEGFAHSVSHDLRSPMRAINRFAQLLIAEFGDEIPAEARKLLNRISGKTRDMGQLIEDLPRFSRLSRQPLVRQPVDISSLVDEVLDELLAEEPHREVAIVVNDLPDSFADPSLLKQVLVNLVANALKFTRHCARPGIEIDGWRDQDECLYCIRDNGAGFDMRDSDKLFGMFQRLHGTDEFEGSGIGLSIVQRVIERHGGRIWAESEVGKGAVFTFSLPVPR